MKNEDLTKLLVASGAVKIQGGKVMVEPGKVVGHWTNDGRHGWRRDPGGGGGHGEQGQDSSD